MEKTGLPIPAQRWVRPGLDTPGLFRQQLPNKYLALAVRGDLPGLRQLLHDHPESLNPPGNHNRTLLWEAARRGHLPVVKWLVARGAAIDATGCYNNESLVQITPYVAAVYYRRPAVAAFLLAQGARLDVFRAAFLGDQAQVAALLAADPAQLNAEDPFDNIYFMPLVAFAVAGGQAETLRYLLAAGAEVSQYSALLLELAVRINRLDLVEQLTDFGVDVRAAASGIFVTARDANMVRYLLEHGASATGRSGNGFTPLTYVARGDKGESPEKAQLLLDWGAHVDEVSPRGRTALHYAAAAGHLAMLQLLLAHGADPHRADNDGATAFDLAAGRPEALKLLKKGGRHTPH